MGHRTIRSRASRLIAGVALMAAALVPTAATAWGYFGHRTTAEIAWANIEHETRAAIARLFAHERELGTP